MIGFIRIAVTALLFLLVSSLTFAQSVPTSLFACLDGNGNLYGVTPAGKLGEGCSTGDLPVSLGSAGAVTAGNGLVGNLTNGVLDIGVADGLAIPPSCPPGQIPISDGNGAWICTLPNLDLNPNRVAKVWVIPEFTADFGRVELRFVNPGLVDVRAICYSFTSNGTRAFMWERVIPTGGSAFCGAGRGPATFVPLWGLLVSDGPVLPSARRAFHRQNTAQIEAHPVDCRYPEGYEFVCEYAIE